MVVDERRDRALAMIDLAAMRGIEVGPSFSPFVPKASGAEVLVVDHADAETLREKYRAHGVDLNAIEDVDFVWSGGPLPAELKAHGPFDYIIASHLLEHLPNPLGFLSDCADLLREGGVLSLVLPDHRYCFDLFRPLTTIGQWLDARDRDARHHSAGTILDHALHAVNREGIAWSAASTGPLTVTHRRADIDSSLAVAQRGDTYVDVHAWVFTPASFQYLIEMGASFDLTRFEIAYAHDTVGFEFFVTLRKPRGERAGPDLFEKRLDLFKAMTPPPPPRPPAPAPTDTRLNRVLQRAARMGHGSRSHDRPPTT